MGKAKGDQGSLFDGMFGRIDPRKDNVPFHKFAHHVLMELLTPAFEERLLEKLGEIGMNMLVLKRLLVLQARELIVPRDAEEYLISALLHAVSRGENADDPILHELCVEALQSFGLETKKALADALQAELDRVPIDLQVISQLRGLVRVFAEEGEEE